MTDSAKSDQPTGGYTWCGDIGELDPGIDMFQEDGKPRTTSCRYDYLPEPSGWECHVFGMNGDFVIAPRKGSVPNWFWRTMQYLAFGNKWVKADR